MSEGDDLVMKYFIGACVSTRVNLSRGCLLSLSLSLSLSLARSFLAFFVAALGVSFVSLMPTLVQCFVYRQHEQHAHLLFLSLVLWLSTLRFVCMFSHCFVCR